MRIASSPCLELYQARSDVPFEDHVRGMAPPVNDRRGLIDRSVVRGGLFVLGESVQ